MRQHRHSPIIPILVLYLMLGFAYSLINPLWEATDEYEHFQYADYLRGNGFALPVQIAGADGSPAVPMAHHPPLYYALSALVIGGIDTSNLPAVAQRNPYFQWARYDPPGGWNVFFHTEAEAFPYQGAALAAHLLRLLSIAMGAITVWIAYRLARLLAPMRPGVAWFAAALVAFNPSFLFTTSSIHNDNLIILLASLSLLWLVTLVQEDAALLRQEGQVGFGRIRGAFTPGGYLYLLLGGLLLGAALLTKLSALALVPLYALALALAAWKRRDYRWGLMAAAIVFGVAGIVSGWWYVRNQILYGDPLGWGPFTATYGFLVRSLPYRWEDFALFLSGLSETYWVGFGYMNLRAGSWLYSILWGVSGLALAGWAIALARQRLRTTSLRRWMAWSLMIAGPVVFFLALVRYSFTIVGEGHARSLFPVIAAISISIALGWSYLLPRRLHSPAALLFTFAMVGLAVVAPYRYMLPAYAALLGPAETELASARPLTVEFGQEMRLLGWQVDPVRVAPGGDFRLSLYWEAASARMRDLRVTVEVFDREGNGLWRYYGPLLSGRLPTPLWSLGARYRDDYDITLPPQAWKGRGSIHVTLAPAGDEAPLPVGDADALALPVLITGQPAPSPAPAIGHELSYRLGSSIALIGYDLSSAKARPGQTVAVTLYWQALEDVAESYHVFVHLLDGQGQPVAQHDSEPMLGDHPTSAWLPQEVVSDPHPFAIPADAAPGVYQLSVGMYAYPSLQRLPVDPSEGPDNSIPLGTVEVGP
ncbi:MAG: phospholipid carrier-dependent glycosyltransferase [Chloroflexi bacterium]|nr:phospholipid carrier-dependent glycosyltransferase [Chloroflexota bacterium]